MRVTPSAGQLACALIDNEPLKLGSREFSCSSSSQLRVASAQEWPQTTVRIVVPFPAGGSADLMPRIVAERLAAKWGQPVVIDNRPGAAGNIGAEIVYKAEPDGYTLLSAPPPPLVINRALYPKLAYDPTQFVPVTVIGAIPNVLLVHPKRGGERR